MSNKEEPPKDPKKDQLYYAQKTKKPTAAELWVGGIFSYGTLLSIIYGGASFARPELIEVAFQKPLALTLCLFGFGVVLISLINHITVLGSSSFQREKDDGVRIKLGSSVSRISQLIMQMSGIIIDPVDDSNGHISSVKTGGGEEKVDPFSYGAATAESSFESYMSNILKSLSAYAAASEVTATKLLDKGVAFMAGGLVFYIVAIVIWQIFANLTHPDAYVMYVGMAACSMTFIVVEFLAAWFFKQYRYYVEVSLSCLRVRSVYDRYLLNYYALREFKGEGDIEVRNKMTEILKEDVEWPASKNTVVNDFNYMIESMGAAHTTLDKMKDLFQKDKGPKANAKVKTKVSAEEA